MKSTGELSVATNFKLKDKIAIHPNDGFDIGLFNHSYMKKICLQNKDGSPSMVTMDCEVLLLNECKNGIAEIGNNFWQRLGKPGKIKLSVDGENIYLLIL
jgi:sorbitol-specific phosphotransferase system component IIA